MTKERVSGINNRYELHTIFFSFRPLYYLGQTIFNRFNVGKFLNVSDTIIRNWLQVSDRHFSCMYTILNGPPNCLRKMIFYEQETPCVAYFGCLTWICLCYSHSNLGPLLSLPSIFVYQPISQSAITFSCFLKSDKIDLFSAFWDFWEKICPTFYTSGQTWFFVLWFSLLRRITTLPMHITTQLMPQMSCMQQQHFSWKRMSR